VIYPGAFGQQQGRWGHVSSNFYERSFIVAVAHHARGWADMSALQVISRGDI
jgi:hypothetical protein